MMTSLKVSRWGTNYIKIVDSTCNLSGSSHSDKSHDLGSTHSRGHCSSVHCAHVYHGTHWLIFDTWSDPMALALHLGESAQTEQYRF